MKISALRLFNVKRFAGRGVAIEGISDGVNVLCAANEYGKSTSFEALHALFFQPYSGTPGDVQRLRPYSGGNPLVQADISTAQGGFRITKQYYGGRSAKVVELATGRLVAQADEAENFIAGLVKGGTAGPAGLLWVRQGITGLERRSRSEEDGDRQVRAGLLESVQGEVEAVTGGRRMAEIMAATDQALSKLVTGTGKPKTGEPYAAAIETRDRLAEEERKLSAEVTALREALDKRTSESKRLAELDRAEDRKERRQAIDEAQAAFDTAKAQSERLRAAEAELRLVREQRDAAGRDLEAFRLALRKAEDLRQKLAEAEKGRGEAMNRRRDAAEAITRTRADAEAAEREEREARTLLARLDAAMRAREASERLGELKTRLGAAEATRRASEETEAKLAQLTIPEKAIDELDALEAEIARLRAVEEAGRPSVAVAYEADATSRIAMDDAPLEDGEERSYDGQSRLVVAGVGTITLRSNRPTRSDGRREQADARRLTLLDSLGVPDLDAARRRQAEGRQAGSELRELRLRLSLLAPDGLPKLREDIAAREAAQAEVLELKEDPEQVRTAVAVAENRRLEARDSLRELEPLQAAADEAFLAAETALALSSGERAQVEAALGPADEREERERRLATTLADLQAKVDAAEANVATLLAAAVDLESAEAALNRVRSVANTVEQEIGTLRETIAGLNAEIRTRSDEAVEEKWREAVEALEAATARVEAFAKEVAVLQRLSSALATARSDARELYLKPVMAELRPLLGLLFDDVSITFDDKTLLPQTILRNGQEEEVERLSGGMREQLSVLTRLAFARLLARHGRPAPVILDDALVYSDDDRIEKMFDALHRQSRDLQIIVFSCRQRAFQKLGGNVLRMTDWQPDL